MNPSGTERIFVYGSLMEGFFNYKKSFEGKVLSRVSGRVRGRLCHQTNKGYPAMTPGDGWVRGELLELEDFGHLLEIADRIERYEEFPADRDNEYVRQITAVELDGGTTVSAWVYWYGRDDLGTLENPQVPIPGGDWRQFMEDQQGR
jgi:gamma-glutamylcyclotransferase (GGCT)/AIG2-like uncharacterized protein YtfP